MRTFLTFAFLLTASVVFSQTTISGIIRARNDGTLPGANVYLRGTYDGASSDASGKFSFKSAKNGNQILIAEFLGYEPFSVEVQLNGTPIQIDIELKETFNKLDAVTITAGMFEASDKKRANTISPLDMITTAGAAGDVFGALQTLPGTTTNGESGRLLVNGGSSDESQTYIDGALVYAPYNSTAPNTATRGRFNPFMFKGTIFSTGGYSAEYGQALSSVLLLNTNDMPEQNQFDVSIMTIGPEIASTRLWETGAITATLGYANLGPYMKLVPQNFEWKQAPESASGAVSIRQKTSGKGLLKIYSSYDFGQFTLAQLNLNTNRMIDYALDNRNFFVNASLKNVLSEKTSLSTSTSFTHDADNIAFDSTSVVKQLHGFHLKEAFSHEFNQKISLRAGAEWFVKSIGQDFTSQQDTLNGNYTNHQMAAFAELEMYASKKFVVRSGLRLEHNTYMNNGKLSPRITAAWKLNTHSQFSAAWGQFYQNPADNFLMVTDKLGYEQATHYILSYQSVHEGRTLRIESYYKEYHHLVKQSSTAFYLPETYSNNGYGYARGFDIFWRDKNSIKNGDYWISYSFLDTRRNYLDYPESAIPSFTSKHNLAIVYKHWFGKIRSYASLNYKYTSPRIYNDPNDISFNSRHTLAYQTLDVSWSFLYKPNIIFYGAVTNLPGFKQEFGRRYADAPDAEGIYKSTALVPGSQRFFILACFITFTRKGTENQLDKIQ